MQNDKRFFAYSLVLMALTIVMLSLLQLDSIAKKDHDFRLSHAIADIQKHHASLRAQVQLAVATRQPANQQSYLAAQSSYHASLDEARALMRIGRGSLTLQMLERAHTVFHALDYRIWHHLKQQQWQPALALVQSRSYRLAQLEHRQLIEVLFMRAQKCENQHCADFLALVSGFQILLLLSGLALAHSWRRIQASRLEAHQVTMRTVMDVVNNNLNQLRLQQIRWQKAAKLPSEDLHSINRLIQETSTALKQIGDLQAYRTSGQGPAELLEWQLAQPASTQQLEPLVTQTLPGRC